MPKWGKQIDTEKPEPTNEALELKAVNEALAPMDTIICPSCGRNIYEPASPNCKDFHILNDDEPPKCEEE